MSVKITDKQRLDWLDKQSDGSNWIARQSVTGRGYRLHNVKGTRYTGLGSVRAAIDAALLQDAQYVRELRKRKMRGKHRGIIETGAGPACKVCGRGVDCWLGPDESPCEHR